MKRKLNGFIAGFLSCALTVGLVGTALAASGTVSFNSVNLRFNGQQISAKGENFTIGTGASVPASILYTDENGGGTTYLPIARISELLGTEIGWDGATGSVRIGEETTKNFAYDSIRIAVVKIGSNYYSFNSTGDISHGPTYTVANSDGETLIFAPDIVAIESGAVSWDLTRMIRLAIDPNYAITPVDTPYVDGCIEFDGDPWTLGGLLESGYEQTQYLSGTVTYTPMWYSYNGKKVYSLAPDKNQTGTHNNIRYYDGQICVNDLLKYWGINKEINVGEYEGTWYIEMK